MDLLEFCMCLMVLLGAIALRTVILMIRDTQYMVLLMGNRLLELQNAITMNPIPELHADENEVEKLPK